MIPLPSRLSRFFCGVDDESLQGESRNLMMFSSNDLVIEDDEHSDIMIQPGRSTAYIRTVPAMSDGASKLPNPSEEIPVQLLAEAQALPIGGVSALHVLSTATLLSVSKWTPFEEMLGLAAVEPFDAHRHGSSNVVSHQWCSQAHPDPTGARLKCLQRVLSNLIAAADSTPRPDNNAQRLDDGGDARYPWSPNSLFSDRSWETLVEAYAGTTSEDVPFTIDKAQEVTEGIGTSIRHGCFWVDYFCSPQLLLPAPSGKSRQAAALQLAAFVHQADNFFILAPSVRHAELHVECGFESWGSRAWCRFERLAAELRPPSRWRPIVIRSGKGRHGLSTYSREDFFGHWARSTVAVQLGHLSCCEHGHVSNWCDRDIIGAVTRDMLSQALAKFKSEGNIQNLRRWTAVCPHLVAGGMQSCSASRLSPRAPPVWQLLRFYSFGSISEVDPVDGTTLLHSCACAGDSDAVRALLAARADIAVRDFEGFSPLSRAAVHGCRSAFELLRGAALERSLRPEDLVKVLKPKRMSFLSI